MSPKFELTIVMSVLLVLAICSAQAHRKPPFNGSIFGKRSAPPSVHAAQPDVAQQAEDLSSACELVASLVPVCSNWLNKAVVAYEANSRR